MAAELASRQIASLMGMRPYAARGRDSRNISGTDGSSSGQVSLGQTLPDWAEEPVIAPVDERVSKIAVVAWAS